MSIDPLHYNTLEEFHNHLFTNISNPILEEDLVEAVNLVPCGHTVNQATAIQLLARENLCPFDRQAFTGYVPNHAMREVVQVILSSPRKQEPSKEAQEHFLRGKKFVGKGDCAGAVEEFSEALRLCPGHSKAQAFLDFCREYKPFAPAAPSFRYHALEAFRKSLFGTIHDPISKKNLTEAVTLEPCGHTVNEETAMQLLAHPKTCPVDRQPITGHVPNFAMRKAVEKILSSLQEPSEESQDHFLRGKELSSKGYLAKAIEELLKALRLCPVYPEAEAFLEFCRDREPIETVFQKDCLKKIDLEPDCAEAYVGLGNTLPEGESIRLLNGTEMTKQALHLKAIALDPNCAEAYNNLGTTLSQEGSIRLLNGTEMTKQALHLKAIALKPDSAEAYDNLGTTLSQEGSTLLLHGTEMTEQALYLKAIALNPNCASAHHNLGTTLSEEGSIRLLNGTEMTQKALYLKAIALNPNVAEAYHNLGNMLPKGGKIHLLNGTVITDQALYLKVISLDPNCASAYHNLGTTLSQEESIRLFNGTEMTKQALYLKAIALNPNIAEAYNNLGYILPQGGSIRLLNGTVRTQKALFLKSIELEPNNAAVYHNLGNTLPQGGSIHLLNGTEMTQEELFLKAGSFH